MAHIVEIYRDEDVKIPVFYQGAKGEPGEKGEKGEPGTAGTAGGRGERGEKGERGLQGLQGIQGEQGIPGDKGERGERGEIGLQGLQGIQGVQGIPGDKGERGEKGERGLQGLQGIQGEQGVAGETGERGERGEKGLQGIQGIQGEQGVPGDKGERGERGERGLQGLQGIQGEQGVAGETGERGERGERGVQGIQGIQGEQGIPGEKGIQGEKGDPGPDIIYSIEAMEELEDARELVYVSNSGKSGYFRRIEGDATPDGYMIIRDAMNNKYAREHKQVFSAEWFGYVADFNPITQTGTDNTQALQRAVDYIIWAGGGAIEIPAGHGLVNDTVYILPPATNQHVPVKITGIMEIGKESNYKGSTIHRTTSGDIFRCNLNSYYLPSVPTPEQYSGLVVTNMVFKGYTSGIKALVMFRTRSRITNIVGKGLDYVIYQPHENADAVTNYCDMSEYRNIRCDGSTLGGVFLSAPDCCVIEQIYAESPTPAFKHLLEIRRGRGFSINGLLFWSRTEQTAPAGSSLVWLYDVSCFTIQNIHVERCYLDNIFFLNGVRQAVIADINTTFLYNTAFYIQNHSQFITIKNWRSDAIINTGKTDFVFNYSNQRDIVIYPVDFVPERELTFTDISGNNTDIVRYANTSRTSGPVPTIAEGTLNLAELKGDRLIRAESPSTGGPVTGAAMVGLQVSLVGNPGYHRSLISANGDWYSGGANNNIPIAYRKILDSNNFATAIEGDFFRRNNVVVATVVSEAITLPKSNTQYYIPTLTSDTSLTLPAAKNGEFISINNANRNFHLTLLSGTIQGIDSTTTNRIPSASRIELVYNGATWRIVAIQAIDSPGFIVDSSPVAFTESEVSAKYADNILYPAGTSVFVAAAHLLYKKVSTTNNWAVQRLYNSFDDVNQFSTQTTTTTAPTKAGLNANFGTQRAGYRRVYTNLTGGPKVFTKLDDSPTSDWIVSDVTIVS